MRGLGRGAMGTLHENANNRGRIKILEKIINYPFFG